MVEYENGRLVDEDGFSTTFPMDFSIADKFGTDAIRDTYNRAFNEWKGQYNHIYSILGRDTFVKLFPLILADRGSEFTNPSAIEADNETGEVRTRVFYCDPQRSDQKGGCEVCHEMIRRVIPKGTSMDHLTQTDIDLMMSHINSYSRKKLNNQSPHQLFSTIFSEDILTKLNIKSIPANEINLTPELLIKR